MDIQGPPFVTKGGPGLLPSPLISHSPPTCIRTAPFSPRPHSHTHLCTLHVYTPCTRCTPTPPFTPVLQPCTYAPKALRLCLRVAPAPPRVVWLGGARRTAPVTGQEQPCDSPFPTSRPRAEAPDPETALSLSPFVCRCCLSPPPHPHPATVLSIHKLPASGATDISFPMKGWRATGDWAKVPREEDRVTIVQECLLHSGWQVRELQKLEEAPQSLELLSPRKELPAHSRSTQKF